MTQTLASQKILVETSPGGALISASSCNERNLADDLFILAICSAISKLGQANDKTNEHAEADLDGDSSSSLRPTAAQLTKMP